MEVETRVIPDVIPSPLNSSDTQIDCKSQGTESSHVTKDFDTINTFKCFVCRSTRAKYRCPGCTTPTCSLPCVKKHKILLECDGIRNKVKFRRLEQFTNLDILSDYRLLEEITREKESKRRDSRFRPRASRKIRLKENVRVLSDVVLHLLPPHFVRAIQNDSSWDAKKKAAKWRIGWDFQGTVVQTSPIKESAILKSALFQATGLLSKSEKKSWSKLIAANRLKLTLMQEKGPTSEMGRNWKDKGGGESAIDEDGVGGGVVESVVVARRVVRTRMLDGQPISRLRSRRILGGPHLSNFPRSK